jgi:hypothetical protein
MVVFSAAPLHATSCDVQHATVSVAKGQVRRLSEGKTGLPIGQVPLTLSRQVGQDLRVVVNDQADENGRFALPRLAKGLYVLRLGESGRFGSIIIDLDPRSRNRWIMVDVGERDESLCSPTRVLAAEHE